MQIQHTTTSTKPTFDFRGVVLVLAYGCLDMLVLFRSLFGFDFGAISIGIHQKAKTEACARARM